MWLAQGFGLALAELLGDSQLLDGVGELQAGQVVGVVALAPHAWPGLPVAACELHISGVPTGAGVGQRSVRTPDRVDQYSSQMGQRSCAKGLRTRPRANTPCERGNGWNINT
jgi:hypothetical protein